MKYRVPEGWMASLFLVGGTCVFQVGCGVPSDPTGIPASVYTERNRYREMPWPTPSAEESPALVVVNPPPPPRRPWHELIGTVTPYREWDLQETAIDSLGRIGAPAVERLAEILRHPDAAYRAQAAQILAHIGPDAAPAVPALIRALKDTHPQVRKAAARALGQIGPAAQDAIDELFRVVEEGGTGQLEPAYVP